MGGDWPTMPWKASGRSSILDNSSTRRSRRSISVRSSRVSTAPTTVPCPSRSRAWFLNTGARLPSLRRTAQRLAVLSRLANRRHQAPFAALRSASQALQPRMEQSAPSSSRREYPVSLARASLASRMMPSGLTRKSPSWMAWQTPCHWMRLSMVYHLSNQMNI